MEEKGENAKGRLKGGIGIERENAGDERRHIAESVARQ